MDPWRLNWVINIYVPVLHSAEAQKHYMVIYIQLILNEIWIYFSFFRFGMAWYL